MTTDKLDEIALRVANGMREKSEYTVLDLNCNAVELAHALLAELSKDVEPSCIVSDTGIIQNVTDRPLEPGLKLFTRPIPANTVEIEQRVAEACANMLRSKHSHEASACAHHDGNWQPAYEYHMTRQNVVSECIDAVESGKWREYL